MIFIKNIIKKKNFKSYFFSFIVVICLLLELNIFNIKISSKYQEILNQEIYRTISIDEIVSVPQNIDVEKVLYDEFSTLIVVKKYEDVNNLIQQLGNINYNITLPNKEESTLFLSMNLISFITYMFIAIILIVYINQFIIDDLNTVKILRKIGYSKNKICKKYIHAFLIIINCAFILSIFLVFFVNKWKLNYWNYTIIKHILLIYFTMTFIISISSFIKLTTLSKNVL